MHKIKNTTFRKALIGMVLIGIMLFLYSRISGFSSASAQGSSFFSLHTVAHNDGTILDKIIINSPPVPPLGYELERATVSLPKMNSASIKILTVPAYEWDFGCSATSGAMIAGYYDRNGFPNLYTGSVNGGVMPLDSSIWPTWTDGVGSTYPGNPLIATRNGLDGRSTRGSIDDYWVSYYSSAQDPYITNGWVQHTWGDAIGDYMKTSQSGFGNVDGSTTFWTYDTNPGQLTCVDMVADGRTNDGTYGWKLFYEARGYTVTDCYNQKTDNILSGGFSFTQFKAEIDAGRPVMLSLVTGPNGHTIVGVGYDDSSNSVYIYDTWDNAMHSMTWGGSYAGMQLRYVSVVKLINPSPQLPIVTTQAPTCINLSTATGNGNVTALGFPNPTQHGVVWNTTGTPTTADSKTSDGAVTDFGVFTSAMTGLTPGIPYHVRAYATNTSGTAYGNEVTFNCLQPPTGVSVSDGTYTDRIRISWNASGGATYYRVYRNTSNTSAGAIDLTPNPPASPYDDVNAAPGTTYWYFVKACNNGICSGFSSSDSGYRAIIAPTGVSASDGTYTDKVQVAWTASSGATHYEIYRNTSNSSNGASLLDSSSASPYDDTSTQAGTTYWYFVKGCNAGICSGFSSSNSGYRECGPNIWTSIGPAGGYTIYDLAIDPDTPATLYAGTYGQGVFKSTNGGGTWDAVNANLSNLNVYALAIDPLNLNTLYAGTYGGGVFQSTNGGWSWSPFNTGLTNLNVYALAIDPLNLTTLYAGTAGGVFKSTYYGGSWSPVNTGLTATTVRALTIDPATPAILYAGTYSGVFKSTSGGGIWEAVNTGLTNLHVNTLAIDPAIPAILYAGTEEGGVFKSTNSGWTWEPVSTGLTTTEVETLAVDPATPAILYAGTWDGGVFRSTNGGGSWSPVNTGLTNTKAFALAINPLSPATLYAGTWGSGVFGFQGPCRICTTTITNDTPDPSVVNQSYTVSFTVSGSYGTPTGIVTIYDGTGASCTATLSGGSGSCALTSITAGSKTLTASYSGDSTYKPSRGTTSHTVNIPPSSLTWNTFIGSATSNYGYSIAVDGSENIYIIGYSNATWGSPINPYASPVDAFVAKFNSSGALVWNTFLGSASDDYGHGIAVDASGNVYVTGYSGATWGSPVNPSGGAEAFVAKLNSSGALVWNTFLGGSGLDYGNGIAVDGSGNVYVTGYSAETWGSPLRSFSGYKDDAFAAKLNSSGGLTWNTFLGGSGSDYGNGITVDGSGNVYVTGTSSATWGSPVLSYIGGGSDSFAVKLNSSGGLTWNTFLGGSDYDMGNGIAVDGSGNVFVTGDSYWTWGSPVRAYIQSLDAFAAKLNSSGGLTWNTFLGGGGDDYGYGIMVDTSGIIYVTGYSGASWGTPVNPYSGGTDAFVARCDSSGALAWNTFLGSANFDYARGITLDTSGNIYVTGFSGATWGSPVVPYSGGIDAFVAKIPPIKYSISGNAGVAGATITYTGGSATADVSGSYTFSVLYGWSGTVTPSKTGYTFIPDHKDYTNVTANQTGQNYTATVIPYTISGNAGVAGATITYTGGSTTADGTGAYSITVAYNWSGTVTPSKPGYTFSPVNRTYTNVVTNQTAQNYTATAITYTISGNAGVERATISYTGGSTIADSTGAYSITVAYNWSGTVTPSKTGYTFSPVNRSYTNVIANQTAKNFTATAITYTISGNAGVAGATITYTGGSTTTDGTGAYSISVAYNWTGTVTPSKIGYSFTPPNRTYANILTDMTGQDYTATAITYWMMYLPMVMQ